MNSVAPIQDVFGAAALSGADADAFAARVADLSSAGLPLGPGLRAAADETRGRLARALRRAAADLDRGLSLTETLAPGRIRLPAHVRGLLLASATTDDMGEVLGELLEQRRQSQELRRKVIAALIYPALVGLLVILLFSIFQYFAILPFQAMFTEFELDLPEHVKVTLWWSARGIWILLCLVVVLPVLVLAARLVLGPVRFRRLLATAPLIGPLWHWSGIAEMTRLLAVLLERRIPLAEALRLTGGGVSDANVRKACDEMALGAADGRTLSDLIEASPRLPIALMPLVAWGERSGELPAALRSASELYVERIETRSMLLRTILPPFAFLAIGAVALAFVNTVVVPVVSLIEGLS